MAKYRSIKSEAESMLSELGQTETIRQLEVVIYELASYHDGAKIVPSSYGNTYQLKFWVGVLHYIRQKNEK
jgi:hypothetical protein